MIPHAQVVTENLNYLDHQAHRQVGPNHLPIHQSISDIAAQEKARHRKTRRNHHAHHLPGEFGPRRRKHPRNRPGRGPRKAKGDQAQHKLLSSHHPGTPGSYNKPIATNCQRDEDYTITAICDYFSPRYGREVKAEELGLHARWERKETLLENLQIPDKEPGRNQTAEKINTVDSDTFFIPSFPTFKDANVLDRLLHAIKKPSRIDAVALTHLGTMTKNNWNLYASFENSIQYRHHMLTGVSGHLQTLTQLLEFPQPTQTQHHLASLAYETAQLMGEIYFDLKDNSTALRYYNTAIALAGETHNHVLLATALGRKSFIPIYNDDPQQALSLLQAAYVRLTDDTSDIIRAWLAAREAEAYAKVENADACAEALERAERYLERARPEEAPSLAFLGEARNVHFTRTMLLGYKGACYTRLRQPTIARAALQEDLASIDPARRIHHAIVIADLARTYIQQGEIPEACRLAREGLLIVVQLKSARVLQRILDLRHELEPWKQTEDVKNLDGQLLTLSYITE